MDLWELFSDFALVVYIMASLLLLVYGLNHYIIILLFKRHYRKGCEENLKVVEAFMAEHSNDSEAWPVVTTQIPLYNEYNVAERVIHAVAELDYPREKHEIQILDDSTDETQGLVDQVAEELAADGFRISVFRREDRVGFKAGALKAGMAECEGDFIAIFDSDFIPNPDFLKQCVPLLVKQDELGLVQARWGHINSEESLLTRAQTLGIDGHFVIEQSARCFTKLFLNFNGTAGLWRKSAIYDAGGWQSDTLTEDMDLSYRAQLKGWRIEYRPDVVVPAELPSTYAAFKNQQFRWAKGSIQTALKLLPTVFRSKASFLAKAESFFHLTHYCIHPLMFTLALFALPALVFNEIKLTAFFTMLVALPMSIACLGPSLLYIVSQHTIHREDWLKRLIILPALMVVGFGICLSSSRAVMEAFLRIESSFVRTPKTGIQRKKNYRVSKSWIPFMEIAMGCYCAVTLCLYMLYGQVMVGPFLALYTLGFLTVGINSLKETVWARG